MPENVTLLYFIEFSVHILFNILNEGAKTVKNSNINEFSTVTDMHKDLLGNRSVSTFQWATLETVFQWTNIVARC
jgi:hypothetical protein